MTPEETKGFANAVKMWNGQEKEKAMKRLMSDEVRKKAFIDAKLASGDIKEEGIMGDLHATYFDALHMYEFLANVITKDIQDITIMSTWEDYRRLFEKPKYEGDFLTQMFDWNLNQEHSELEEAELKKAIAHLEVADDESWESFNDEIQSVKYKTKHAAKKWKKAIIRSKIEEFKTQSFRPTEQEQDSMPAEFKIKCEDFWKKRDDPRRDQLFRKMHPLIFLKEQLPSYIKI
jgi:hypothetical protein